MKKACAIAIFVFLTGLFAGLFFSTGLEPENHDRLSSLLLQGLSSSNFIRSLISSVMANFLLAAMMIAAIFSKMLCPFPFLLLFYKSFSLGFCSGLIHTSSTGNVLILTLLKFFPQNLFFVPAFILLAAVAFSMSLSEIMKTNRHSREWKRLKSIVLLIFVLLSAGCITEAACRLIAL